MQVNEEVYFSFNKEDELHVTGQVELIHKVLKRITDIITNAEKELNHNEDATT